MPSAGELALGRRPGFDSWKPPCGALDNPCRMQARKHKADASCVRPSGVTGRTLLPCWCLRRGASRLASWSNDDVSFIRHQKPSITANCVPFPRRATRCRAQVNDRRSGRGIAAGRREWSADAEGSREPTDRPVLALRLHREPRGFPRKGHLRSHSFPPQSQSSAMGQTRRSFAGPDACSPALAR